MPRPCVQFPVVQSFYMAACPAQVADPVCLIIVLQELTFLHVDLKASINMLFCFMSLVMICFCVCVFVFVFVGAMAL